MNATPDIPDAGDKMPPRGSSKQRLSLRWDIRDERVRQWINRADLARISGEEGRYLELLERVGVDSVAELGRCDAASLLASLGELNKNEKLVSVLPGEAQLRHWIEQARIMTSVDH